MHPRSMAVIISSIYLFTPMLFVEPSEIFTLKKDTSFSVLEKPGLIETLNGKGGPEDGVIPKRDPITNTIVYEDDPRYELSESLDIREPVVTVTKTYNYLKVLNTSMPVDSSEVSSGYGWRTPPCKGCSSDHQGIDFVPGNGEPVYAISDGMVYDMGSGGGYGNYVILKHLIANSEGQIEEWTSLYAHLQNNSFPEGMMIGSVVKTREQIGRVGNTGVSTGPHLHFELKINDENVDPLPLLGTYEVLIVSEEEYPDYLFVGAVIKVIETTVGYE